MTEDYELLSKKIYHQRDILSPVSRSLTGPGQDDHKDKTMKRSNRHKTLRLLASASALILALAGASLPVFAGIPGPTDYFYVADYADVLSEPAEQSMLAGSEFLDSQYGAQIVVAAVNFTDGMDIEDYAYRMFNSWEIGSSSDKGLLILLSIGDDNYWVMPGKGLESSLPASVIQNILDEKMEPSFAVQDYERAVLDSYDAFYDKVSEICGATGSSNAAPGQTSGHTSSVSQASGSDQAEGGSGLMKYGIAAPLICLVLILYIFRKILGGGRRSSYQAPPAHRSAGRQRPGTPSSGSFSGRSTGRSRSSGPGAGAGFGAGLGLGMMMGMKNSTPPPHDQPPGRTASSRLGGNGPTGPSGSGRPTGGFSGKSHSGGGGSTRGGGAGRR